ncbi:MAG: hypothetical protein ABIH49_01765 [archaeon]
MKKEVVFFGILILSLVFFLNFISAQNETCDDDCKITNAYECVDDKIGDCSSLSSEEAVFSLLARGQCLDEVKDDSKYQSDIKYTAQALLGSGDEDAETWLLSRNMTPTNLDWYLQIDNTDTGITTCTASYTGNANTITLEEDKSISSVSGENCLAVDPTGYWLSISSSCYDEEFSVSCDKAFTTSLLYQKSDSDVFYISDETHSGSANSETNEKINSYCFRQGNSCDYEGSLWASVAMDSLGYDVSSYLPYLITHKDDSENIAFLPEAFLHKLTGNYKIDVLQKQISSNNQYYWQVSNDKYYDTALALFPFRFDSDFTEKTNTENWLLTENVQGNDGCWNNGNLKDTAFLLYSLWPRNVPGADTDGAAADCETSGFYCSSTLTCSQIGGQVLPDYTCSGAFVCCSQQKVLQTCSEQLGAICNSNQVCSGGTIVDSSDAVSGQLCCVSGTCETKTSTGGTGTESACEQNSGVCRITGCNEGEEETIYSCDFSSDSCCIPKQSAGTGGGSTLWIWILGVLIVLVIVAIIFRDKLRTFWFRIKSRGSRSSQPRGPPPRFPPSGVLPVRRPIPRAMPTRSPSRTPPRIPQRPKPSGELSDVLKKLKEMGK